MIKSVYYTIVAIFVGFNSNVVAKQIECRDVETNQVVEQALLCEQKTEVKTVTGSSEPIVLFEKGKTDSLPEPSKNTGVIVTETKTQAQNPVVVAQSTNSITVKKAIKKNITIKKIVEKKLPEKPVSQEIYEEKIQDAQLQKSLEAELAAKGINASEQVIVTTNVPRVEITKQAQATKIILPIQTAQVAAGSNQGYQASSGVIIQKNTVIAAAPSQSVKSVEAEELTLETASEKQSAQYTKYSQTSVVKAPIVNPVLKNKKYMNFVAGGSDHPEVANATSSYAFSAAFGQFHKQVMMEMGFGIAKNELSVRNYTLINHNDKFDVNLYQLFGAVKYPFFKNYSLRPHVGALAAFTYRQYNLNNSLTNNSGDTGNSQALDAGVSLGADYEFSDKYAIGADLKYLFNLSHKVNANYVNPNFGYTGSAIENFQYYLAGLSFRMNF